MQLAKRAGHNRAAGWVKSGVGIAENPLKTNDQERCDQAVVHAQVSTMDRNSSIALFLYRRRKRRRNGLHWFHPIIQKREEFGAS
jgi:hypothetical protein